VAIFEKCSLLKSASLLTRFAQHRLKTALCAENRDLETRVNTGFVCLEITENFGYHLEKLQFEMLFPKSTRTATGFEKTAKFPPQS
jgi:hypothetical protein